MELAEVLAFDFNAEGIPKLNPAWRWEDQEEAVMSACSSLVMIVKDGDSRVVQFSHFSVKEFLTANRLVEPIKDVSCYHIRLEAAHTILAQTCLGVLLLLDDCVDRDNIENSPLARYAAHYGSAHARFASPWIRDGMERLFYADKPQFATWLWIYNEDEGGLIMSTMYHEKPQAIPLYYEARLGFYDLARHLIAEHPEHVNARGGADVDGGGIAGQTPLHRISENGELEVARYLLDRGADINVQDHAGWTLLGVATFYGHIKFARMLLRCGASVNIKMVSDETSLHVAADRRNIQAVQLLLEHGANVHAGTNRSSTPLHVAARGSAEIARMLLEHGANVGAEDKDGRTPLHIAAQHSIEVVHVLLEHDANVGVEDNLGRTPLHGAAQHGSIEIVRMLFEHGAEVNARSNYYIGM
jgi:hypothetical protein